MEKRLPLGAYEHYVALGAGRSYRAVAEHFGVSKQTVTARAVKENWQERITELEKESHDRSDEKFLETIDEANRLHFKAFRAVLVKGIEAIKQLPMATAMDGVRAIEIAFKNERILRGEPSEHQAVSVEEVLRKQHAEWLTTKTPEEQWADYDSEGLEEDAHS